MARCSRPSPWTTASLSVALSIIGAPRASLAQPAPIEIAYEADPGCPAITELLGKIRQRAGVDVAPSTDPSAPVRIRLHASGATFSGRLEMLRAGGDYVRELIGPSCDETASALAFVVAQALLPEDASAGEEEPVLSSGVVESTRTVIPPTVVDRPRTPPVSENRRIAWWAGINGGVIAVISRYDLVFDNPKTLVFPMPGATVAGSLGVAWRVW
jgi:hypothetical protein